MSYCIDYNSINYDNIHIGEKHEVIQSYMNKYESNNLYYKYSNNIFKQLKFITDFIEISYYFDKKIFNINDIIIQNIEENLQNKYNLEKKINDNYKYGINLLLINSSKIILYPLKKYNIDKVIIENTQDNNISNYDVIKKYFPYINRKNNGTHARFVLKPYVIDNRLKFAIDKCEIKYVMKKVKSELKINNIYENKLNINL